MTHMKHMFFSLAVGLVALHVVTVNSVCLFCSSISKAACLNETGFAVCFDGTTVSNTHGVCPDGQVCTETVGICKPRAIGPLACGKCNLCNLGFSCRSRTQFEFCSNNLPAGVVVNCPEGQYCNVKNLVKFHNICVKSCTMEPTCYADEVPPAPEPTYKDVCTGKPDKQTYENIYDPTCKTYVYCETLDMVMNAVLYTCTSGYYNAALVKCTPEIPARCA